MSEKINTTRFSAELPKTNGYGGMDPVGLWKQYLWDNWWTRSGPCEDCDIRCDNTREFPAYGAFNHDAELMIVGLEPGVNSRSTHTKDNKRRVKDTPVDAATKPPRFVGQRRYEEHILGSTRYADIFPTEDNPGEDIDGWDFYYQPYDGDDIGLINLFSPRVSTAPLSVDESDIYYTNSLKCSPLASGTEDVDNPSERNSAARVRCRPYLADEIELVAPSVIVPFGPEATAQTIKAIGYEDCIRKQLGYSWKDVGNINMNIFIQGRGSTKSPGFSKYGENPTIIPSYHWVPRLKNQFIPDYLDAWVTGIGEYWDKLAATIQDSLE